MHSFVYYNPTKVVFGKDTQKQAAKLAKEFGASRVMIVYGSGSVVRSGLLAEIEAIMAQEEIPCCTLGGVQPNPRTALAREGAKQAVEFGADFILAVGGGSPRWRSLRTSFGKWRKPATSSSAIPVN